jgi:hypothetical protein
VIAWDVIWTLRPVGYFGEIEVGEPELASQGEKLDDLNGLCPTLAMVRGRPEFHGKGNAQKTDGDSAAPLAEPLACQMSFKRASFRLWNLHDNPVDGRTTGGNDDYDTIRIHCQPMGEQLGDGHERGTGAHGAQSLVVQQAVEDEDLPTPRRR